MHIRRMVGFGLLLFGAIVIGLAGFVWYARRADDAATSFKIERVARGDLSIVVNATGTVEPEEVVDVGAQVVGMIKEFGIDAHASGKPIDFLSQVEQGTVLARIDDAVYRARDERAAAMVEQAQAQREQALLNTKRAEADLVQVGAKYRQAERDWKRAQRLQPTNSISEADFDAAQTAFEVGQADLHIAEVAVDQQKAAERLAAKAVAVAEADRIETRQNLAYTVIRSPVNGVIVDRRVNIGQTVVSSLNAPSLFLIAKDLKRLQVWASVNEADIGRLRRGQHVRFTVDAFPNETFVGDVSQVRLNAAMTQNVVTYTVVVEADNSSGKLLPYLTANLQFEVERRPNAVLAPNAALRWQPTPEAIIPDLRPMAARWLTDRSNRTETEPGDAERTSHRNMGVVWTVDGTFVRPIEVQVGLSDGERTEILGGELSEEREVVVGQEKPSSESDSVSPFSPQVFGGGRR